jgi:threonine aldolase
MQHFASDNYAGICPEALEALTAANNSGHEPAYGDDSWTNQVWHWHRCASRITR